MMKRKYFLVSFIIFLFFSVNIDAQAETDYSVWVKNSLSKIKKREGFQFHPLSNNLIAEVKAAKNEYEAIQLVLRSKSQELKDIKILVTDLEGDEGNFIKKENIKIFLENYVHIRKFTTSPGWYPDALVPYKNLDLISHTIQPIWISVFIPDHTNAGNYKGSIIIKPSNAEKITVTLKVTVWDFSLPKAPYLKTSFGIKLSYIAKRHKIPQQSKELKDMRRIYNENAINHRVSPVCLIDPSIIEKDNSISIDFTDFDKEMQHYLDLGLNSFAVCWHRFPPAFVKVSNKPLKNERITKRTREILKLTEEHLREKGWLKLSRLYVIDEPRKEYFPQIKEIFTFFEDCAPDIKRLLTLDHRAFGSSSKPAYRDLAGYVDIWAVITSAYHEGFLKERQKMGEEVWWYVCCNSKHPYANFWAIDYPAIDHRIVFWQAWKYNIEGFLYWAINYWEENVWENPISFPGTNGDGSLIYWNKEGPVNSIRWEIIRDGIEDYDYFCMLRNYATELTKLDRDKKYTDLVDKAKELLDVSDLTPSLTEYTKQPQKLFNRREEIANLIVEINHIINSEGKL